MAEHRPCIVATQQGRPRAATVRAVEAGRALLVGGAGSGGRGPTDGWGPPRANAPLQWNLVGAPMEVSNDLNCGVPMYQTNCTLF